MATLEEQQEEILRDPDYVNWVKGALSLKVTKKGLEHFITTNTDKFHADTLNNLATSANCSNCSNKEIIQKNKKCPYSVCDQIKNTIVNEHRFRGPTWKNTDVQCWCKDPWELAKCFMPPGYESKTSASETDFAGLLAVIINHKMFDSQVTASLATKSNIFCEARDVRNKILHQADEKLTNQELKDCITKLDSVLSDPVCLAVHPDAIDAKLMLDTILIGSLSITNEDIQEAQELRRLEKRRDDAVKVLQAKTDVGLSALDKKEKHSETVLQTKTDDGLLALDKKEKNSETVLQAKTDVGLSALDKKEKHSETVIQGKTDDGLSALDKKEKHSETVLQSKTDDGLSALDKKEKHSETIIQAKTEEGLTVIQAKIQDGLTALNTKEKDIQTASQDSYGQTKKDEIYKNILRNCYTKLVDEMDPTLVIDQFHEIEFLPSTTLRDISENNKTSDKNRAIVDKVLTKGNQGYMVFKECLKKTKQDTLLSHLSEVEDQLSQGIQPSASPGQPSLQQQMQQAYSSRRWRPRIYTDMVAELISIYQDGEQMSTPLLPLVETEHMNIDEMYVKPEMKINNQLVQSYKDIFKDKIKKIYVVGDAGLGKTSLCQKMISTWCKVQKYKYPTSFCRKIVSYLCCVRSVLDDDEQAMAEFDYLFYISLRDAITDIDVDDMIKHQLLANKFHGYLSTVLEKKTCLVILDGLDEWATENTAAGGQNKGIPGRQNVRNCTILTTTRPWKLEAIKLKSTQIDVKVELFGIDEISSDKLIEIMLKHLNKQNNKHMEMRDFSSKLKENKLDHFRTIPVILKQLICLWFSGKPLGQTKSVIYSQTIELLLELSQSRLNEDTKYQEKQDEWINSSVQLPSCFDENDKCQEVIPLLFALGRLSFYTSLNENQESSLVFKQSEVQIHGMTPEDIKISLKIGVLSQSCIVRNCTSQKRISFLHKSYQEFFAALHVSVDHPEYNQCVQTIQQNCNSKRKCLEMQNMITFISGMSSDTTCTLIGHIASHFNDRDSDEWQQYLKECLCEGWCCSHGNKHLLCDRVQILDDYKPEHLELLCQANIHNMKELNIETPPTASCLEFILQVETLKMLSIESHSSTTPVISEDNLYSLLQSNSSTLTHLWIESITLRSRTKLSTLLQHLPHLCWLYTSGISMSQQLCDSLKDLKAQRPDIEVGIWLSEILADTECID